MQCGGKDFDLYHEGAMGIKASQDWLLGLFYAARSCCMAPVSDRYLQVEPAEYQYEGWAGSPWELIDRIHTSLTFTFKDLNQGKQEAQPRSVFRARKDVLGTKW